MEFIKKKIELIVKYLFRFLIALILFEVILGYAFYLKNSSKLTGNYISSTLKLLNKIEVILGYKIKENIIKENKTEQKSLVLNCKKETNYNQTFEVADMTFFRRPIKFQTNIDFLNTAELTDKYIIFIAGNSETFGYYQNEQKRIHTILQEKLKNEFKSKNIFVVNLADIAQFINDHLKSVQSFSEIYNPDLVIFYTGGNEVAMDNSYKDMINRNLSLNIENKLWYSFFNGTSTKYIKCLDEKFFLTKNNFKKEHTALDVQNYIKESYSKTKKFLVNKNIDFIFYIHPFNDKIKGTDLLRSNIKKLKDIDISDDSFINLSSKNLDLEFVDNYHTKNSNLIATEMFNQILMNYEKKIKFKINKKNN